MSNHYDFTNPSLYRATGSVHPKGSTLQTIVTLHYPDGHSKQISRTTKLAAFNKNGSNCAANWKEAKRLLEIRKTDAIAQAVSEAIAAATAKVEPERDPADILFVDACEAWVAKHTCAETTRDAYVLTCKAHIRPYFEPLGLYLSDIDEDVLQDYIDAKTDPNATKPLTGKTVKKHMAVMTGTLKDRKNKKIAQPIRFDTLEYPTDKKFEATVYKPEELQLLLDACKNSPIRDAIILTSMLGLRRSEVLGLKWSLVDLDRGLLRVRDVVVCITKTHHKEQPKNQSSDRIMLLSDNLVAHLRAMKKQQEQYKQKFGDTYIDNDFVCKYPDGKPFPVRYFYEMFSKILRKSGLKKVRLHDLRHTFATLLIADGVSVSEVQESLGHAYASTTLNTYVHSFKAREQVAVKKHASGYTF